MKVPLWPAWSEDPIMFGHLFTTNDTINYHCRAQKGLGSTQLIVLATRVCPVTQERVTLFREKEIWRNPRGDRNFKSGLSNQV